MPDRTSLVIVDEHPVFRAGLKQVLTEQSDMEILAEASDGDEALGLLRMLKPDIVLLDVDMPKLNGIDTAETIHREQLPVSVILLTVYDDEELLNHAMEHGVMGYILKDGAVSEIARGIRQVRTGKYYISQALSAGNPRHRYEKLNPDVELLPELASLSPAERRVLTGVASNRTSGEIAEELFISARTVDHHRASICRKLGLTGQYALVRFALENRDMLQRVNE